MTNKELLNILIDYPDNAIVKIDNFESDISSANIINVALINGKIILQIHGDSFYVNTATYNVLKTEHDILEKLLEELQPLVKQNQRFFKNTKINSILSQLKLKIKN